MRLRLGFVALLGSGLIATPATAATTFGSALSAAPDNNDACHIIGAGSLKCTVWNITVPAGDTASGGAVSPFDGVLVRWRVKVAAFSFPDQQLQAAPRVIRSTTGISSGALQPIPGGGTFTFDTRQPIKLGDLLGIDTQVNSVSQGAAPITVGTGGNSYTWSPGFLPNSFTNPGSAVNDEVLMNGDVEADADADGFGDETQDKCAGSAGANDGCPQPKGGTGANVPGAPTLSQVSLSASRFAIDKSGAVARKKRKSKVRGTTIRFTLSEPATVSAAIERSRKGRKSKGKCKAKAKRGKRCTLLKSAGSFSLAGAAGANQKPFSGRLKSGNLKPGSYRMTLIATDAAGNKSKPAATNFTIVR